MTRSIIFGIGWSLLMVSGCTYKSEVADMIIHNGKIITLDFENSKGQAIAVKNGMILEVGPNRAILNKYQAEEYVDLKGGVVMPGLMDAHAHLVGYADGLLEANLVGSSSWEEAISRMESHQEEWPFDWGIGRGWDQNDWSLQSFPTRRELDSIFPSIPVAMERIDGHAMVVNATALQLAGIVSGELPQVEGGEILVDDDGEPTGVLIDNACELIQRLIPTRSNSERLDALVQAQDQLFQVGLVGVTDAGLPPAEIERLDSLQREGILKLRLNVLVSASDSNISWLVDGGRIMSERLVVNGVKFYMDGALGSRGAMLREPYSDRPEWHGLLTQDIEQYRSQLSVLYENNLQAATHCIGDSAVRLVVQEYADLLNGTNDRRWRIEHAQVVSAEDVADIGLNNLIPSIQTTHATSDMYWAGERLGRNRIRRAYAYQELLNAIGMVAIGTDFPVEDIDPRKTFVSGVARVDAVGYPAGGFQPENALSPEQTLRGMTQWVSLAQFQETQLGTIEPGKWADFTWVDRDWLSVDPMQVLTTEVMGTCIGGEWVYLKDE
ncbi:MAG: amidohydrolase [Flavobacteriales bacterium]